MKLPIEDGQIIETRRGPETVMGEIERPHSEPVCWTLQGNWYRRRDGEPMTIAGDQVMTLREFFRLKAKGEVKP